MRKKDIEKLVFNISSKIAMEQNIKVCDVEYIKEAGYYYLRVYLDKEEGISLDDCQGISRLLSKELDELDPVEENYFLEVSSLGLDRPLKTIELVKEFMGTEVDVNFYKKIDGSKKYTGKVVSVEEELIKLKISESEDEYLEFQFEEASKISLSVDLQGGK